MTTRRYLIMACLLTPALVALLGGIAPADPFTHVLSFQGRLSASDGKPLPDGPYTVTFIMYDVETGGTGLWRELQGVTQVGGVFVAYLGSVRAFPDDLFTSGNRWLAIKVGADPEMATRVRLTPSPWAIRAATADTAIGADTVDGFHASSTPTPNYILPLDAVGKLPMSVIPADADWRLTGNVGTSPLTNFLGTTDNQPLVFRTNNVEVARINIVGHLGIGTTSPRYPLDVNSASDEYGEAAIHGVVSSTGTGQAHWGVYGETRSTCDVGAGAGVLGASFAGSSSGVFGDTSSTSGTGVFGRASASSGTTYGVRGTCTSPAGYAGYFDGRGYFSGSVGIGTTSPTSILTVVGDNASYPALSVTHTPASNNQPAILGVHATDDYGYGVRGVGGHCGVEGKVEATGNHTYYGMYGNASGGLGTNYAMYGYANSGKYNYAVYGNAEGGSFACGVYGAASGATQSYAGYFFGDVVVTGTLSKGSGSFKIDHPLDPENKYLSHSFVESPDMMNIYNGNVVTDERGYATITMPDWFDALNRDFRYQLTVIDSSDDFAMAKVTREIEAGSFVIRTSAPNVKVSWMVTGIRQDAYANLHRIPVEEDKVEGERGKYLHPDAYGRPMDEGIGVIRQPETRSR